MTSQSDSAAAGARRRPTPPRPAAAPQYAFAAPVTYTPDAYDPKQVPAVASSLPGQFGLVYPAQRTSRSVWVALLLIIASVIGFVGWRAQHSGASDSSSGITYTSTGGHFVAHFPSQPTETTRTSQYRNARFAFHTVAVQGAAVVVEAAISGHLPADPQTVRGYMIRRITSGGMGLTSVKALTFRGAPARQGNLVEPTGDVFSVLVLAPSARRYYVLAAPLGTQFDALKESFRILS